MENLNFPTIFLACKFFDDSFTHASQSYPQRIPLRKKVPPECVVKGKYISHFNANKYVKMCNICRKMIEYKPWAPTLRVFSLSFKDPIENTRISLDFPANLNKRWMQSTLFHSPLALRQQLSPTRCAALEAELKFPPWALGLNFPSAFNCKIYKVHAPQPERNFAFSVRGS